MPIFDMGHEHVWERLGVVRGSMGEIEVIYECAECNCWSARELERSGEVAFHRGHLAGSTQGTEAEK